jgi:hypothetical protein
VSNGGISFSVFINELDSPGDDQESLTHVMACKSASHHDILSGPIQNHPSTQYQSLITTAIGNQDRLTQFSNQKMTWILMDAANRNSGAC